MWYIVLKRGDGTDEDLGSCGASGMAQDILKWEAKSWRKQGGKASHRERTPYGPGYRLYDSHGVDVGYLVLENRPGS